MIYHTLSGEDQQWATEVAEARVRDAKGNPRFAYDYGSTPLHVHANAAMAQLAAARVLGLEWSASVNTYGAVPNVNDHLWWNARWSSNVRRVKIAPKDQLDWIHLHLTGKAPTFEIHGYINVSWVKTHCSLEDPGDRGFASYFTIPEKLAPLELGFHKACHWSRDLGVLPGTWRCIFCGSEDLNG